LRSHERSVHLKERPHACEHCGKSYSVKHGLQGHIKSVHSNERPHKCKYCVKTFSLLVRLRVHEKSVHLRVRPHACDHCGKSFPKKGNLQKHISSVHLGECLTKDATPLYHRRWFCLISSESTLRCFYFEAKCYCAKCSHFL
ncbi:unnamed protein product, partial [Dicrocoelium dendriticum]